MILRLFSSSVPFFIPSLIQNNNQNLKTIASDDCFYVLNIPILNQREIVKKKQRPYNVLHTTDLETNNGDDSKGDDEQG